MSTSLWDYNEIWNFKDIIYGKIRITTKGSVCTKLYRIYMKTYLLLNKMVFSVKQPIIVWKKLCK